jgi:hypothetical protein
MLVTGSLFDNSLYYVYITSVYVYTLYSRHGHPRIGPSMKAIVKNEQTFRTRAAEADLGATQRLKHLTITSCISCM